MRWREKDKLKTDDIRTKRYFALFPVHIDGEVRWLEMVTVEQSYFLDTFANSLLSGWIDKKFIN